MKVKFAKKEFMAAVLFGVDVHGHECSNLRSECTAKNFSEYVSEVKSMVDTFNFVTEDGGLHLGRNEMEEHFELHGALGYFYTQMPSVAAMRASWREIKEWRKN